MKRMAKAASNKVGITARKLCRKYGVASSFVTKVLKKEGVTCYKGQKGTKASPELVSRPKKCCRGRAMVRNHCKPSSQTELVLRKDIPQNVPQLARSKICHSSGLHLRWPCTVVAGKPKTRSSWREEREVSESWIGMSSEPWWPRWRPDWGMQWTNLPWAYWNFT